MASKKAKYSIYVNIYNFKVLALQMFHFLLLYSCTSLQFREKNFTFYFMTLIWQLQPLLTTFLDRNFAYETSGVCRTQCITLLYTNPLPTCVKLWCAYTVCVCVCVCCATLHLKNKAKNRQKKIIHKQRKHR